MLLGAEISESVPTTQPCKDIRHATFDIKQDSLQVHAQVTHIEYYINLRTL